MCPRIAHRLLRSLHRTFVSAVVNLVTSFETVLSHARDVPRTKPVETVNSLVIRLPTALNQDRLTTSNAATVVRWVISARIVRPEKNGLP